MTWLLAVAAGLAAGVACAMVCRRAARRARLARTAALLPPGRAMGNLECLFDSLHRIGGFLVVYALRVEGSLEERTLRAGLDALQARHPLLQVKVTGPGGIFEAGAGPIPLRLAPRTGLDAWKAEVEAELHAPIPYGPDPLLRAVWLGGEKGGELLLSSNHAITDGMSSFTLIRDLLEACAAHRSGRAQAPGPAERSVPPLDARLPVLPGRTPRGQGGGRHLPWDGASRPEGRRSVPAFLSFDEGETAALVARCRAEGTSVHGAVCAAALLALRMALGPGRALSLASNVDLRKLVDPPVPESVVGCFASGVTTRHEARLDSPFWDLARDVRAGIQDALARGEALQAVARPFRAGVEGRFLRLLPWINQGRLVDVNVSSKGVQDPGPDGCPFIVREVHSAASRHGVGSLIQVGTSTLGGRLFASLVHVEPLMSRARAARLESAFQALLRRAGAPGDFCPEASFPSGHSSP